MGAIYLIRHGQASFSKKDYDRLSDIGFQQATHLGNHLALFGRPFDAIYHGDLNRQRQTAETVIACHQKSGRETAVPTVSSAFNEYDVAAVWKTCLPDLLKQAPALSNQIDKIRSDPKAFHKVFARLMLRWITGAYDNEGIPRWKDFSTGVIKGLYRLMQTHGNGNRVAVFTSGGPIALAVREALNLSDEKTLELSWQVMNASVTHLKYKGDRITLAGFNDITHLRMAGDGTLLTYR